ncbi:MAG: ATP-binding cassette domain-containing protein, partial [Gemmatimonadaceae bacterium]|nr:ATP-binding cassette domain-containing protein [Gemmatimonadaceae bacterium]
AGKSTILKLLIQILQPTIGHCVLRGRVGALIEVAAGFHPDLTGRENVFLQGAIMGMPRREIAGRFDEIVEFSGIPDFIDTPVKRYSSGMQARLGFAIAAHLDPDVLIIDEVLAVGDAAFQQKAFGRVQELVRGAIPVVVVSHQLTAITSLCTRGLLLDRGRVVCMGTPDECVAAYLGGVASAPIVTEGDGALSIETMSLSHTVLASGEQLRVTLHCAVREDGWTEHETIRIGARAASDGQLLFETSTEQLGVTLPAAGAFTLTIDLQMNVQRGIYLLESCAWDRSMGRRSFTGPVTSIDVRDGTPFDGIIQLNASAEVTTAPRGIPPSRARDRTPRGP